MSRTIGDSYSGGESGHTSMGDNTSPPENRNRRSSHLVGRRRGRRRFLDDEEDDFGGREEEDDEKNEVWESFSKSFSEVQTVLDQNRVLIQQVNENHQSKIPDNMTKNVALIREINGNIGKVASLYSNLSSSFTHVVQELNVTSHQPPASKAKEVGEGLPVPSLCLMWYESIRAIHSGAK
ncbi:hypothetical protein H6P81_006908 [Aristolochia fimbriata]|uniref:Protein EARLY FLOWERING 4 domain-containing protein n=1 Tax=Aristolochia fimbriata TaxID=158543 RepID=A0AAV7EZH5_ARIFI|nr:hypothetical protein H6P81_006908 [Aristolochia fimbriata]